MKANIQILNQNYNSKGSLFKISYSIPILSKNIIFKTNPIGYYQHSHSRVHFRLPLSLIKLRLLRLPPVRRPRSWFFEAASFSTSTEELSTKLSEFAGGVEDTKSCLWTRRRCLSRFFLFFRVFWQTEHCKFSSWLAWVLLASKLLASILLVWLTSVLLKMLWILEVESPPFLWTWWWWK